MKVSFDHGSTWIDTPYGVKVDVEIPELGNEEASPSIIFNFNPEGLTQNCYDKHEVCRATHIVAYDDIYTTLME